MGDVEDAKVSLILGNPTDHVKGGGWFEGIWSQGALSVKYQTADGDWQGILHKGRVEDFQRACSGVAESKKP